jgi:chloramphenicol-sensitive protein RarD
MAEAEEEGRTSSVGIACCVAAYGVWGLFPIYFKAVASVPAIEVLAHRILWSALLLALILTASGHWTRVSTAMADRRSLSTLVLSALAVALNWGVFIWAVASGLVLQSALGYFVLPLVSVALGVLVLGERLRRAQWVAVGLAAAGVAHQVLAVGVVPWVALALALSFGLYGLLRKTVMVDPVTGLFVEALLLGPAALIALAVAGATGTLVFGSETRELDLLLVLAGPVTTVPLILFVAGTRRIRLVTVGLLQYITPTAHFSLAVFVFAEPFPTSALFTFALIWLALAIYTIDVLRHGRGRRPIAP